MKFTIETLISISVIAAAIVNYKSVDVQGAAFFTNTVFCSDIVTSTGEPSFEVCSIAYYTSPSPAALENGTVIYLGGYSAAYVMTKGLAAGVEATDDPNDFVGIGVSVTRDDLDICTVVVQYLDPEEEIQCNSCKYCGDESYSVDCSNVKYGRTFDVCESTMEGVVFFPFTNDALLNRTITTIEVPSNYTMQTTGGGGGGGGKPPKQQMGGNKPAGVMNGGKPQMNVKGGGAGGKNKQMNNGGGGGGGGGVMKNNKNGKKQSMI